MSGSGNDFVMVDARVEPPGVLASAAVVQRVCARRTGVGADGIAFLEPSDRAAVRLTYLNADGSLAELCGNATLCTARLAVELGIGKPTGFDIETDSGIVGARLSDGQPEIDLQPVDAVTREAPGIPPHRGEERVGFVVVGVPHLVVQCADVAAVDVIARGRPMRRHASLREGANVNFVSPGANGRWRMRTYERGVEGETLACGSGSVATAILLTEWGHANGKVELETSSGRVLTVSLRHVQHRWAASLRGEGRVVYQAQLSEI